MAETLTSLIDRVEVFLADSTNKSWATGTITECIRYALNEINQAARTYGAQAYTINGLDLAIETTLPSGHLETLIMGTAAYGAKNRAVDRLEKANLGEGPTKGLDDWGDWAEAQFNKQLAAIRKRALQNSQDEPNSEWTWDEEPHKW